MVGSIAGLCLAASNPVGWVIGGAAVGAAAIGALSGALEI